MAPHYLLISEINGMKSLPTHPTMRMIPSILPAFQAPEQRGARHHVNCMKEVALRPSVVGCWLRLVIYSRQYLGVFLQLKTIKGSSSSHEIGKWVLRRLVKDLIYPLVFPNIAGWNITIFNRKYIDSIRVHFPLLC